MKENMILIVEDEREIGELVRDYLNANGYQVIIAEDGEEGLQKFKQRNPMLVVLDVMLPKKSGIDVCREIRLTSNVPIIMMSAKKSETDKIIGLGIGADDYIAKPFSPSELVARIKAQLRRYTDYSELKPMNTENVLRVANLVINVKGHTVTVSGKKVELSAKEFQLLHFMANNKGQVFSKEQLFDTIWGYDSYGDMNAVTVYIRKIREKIEDIPSQPKFIVTVWGVGYKFDGSV
ncbi:MULTISPECIES: response regulator transcription factor [Sutcliffiella]|uniref:DNA-binding response regulator n=1 Tax=Sutcliffiella cohnii TaxID=33932 RepID=A0A223KVQ7_9BACI|nr:MULTISPECIES: response regulator transcription factor [Sutcliffiella]AST93569.1 DNA-binding response regulator [Sutcliffiella cohnii]WBL14758.1 response regulator transcription factor [Sutcliffiella sp. NC1]